MAQEIIPPKKSADLVAAPDNRMRMPEGTPFGVGILGAMRLAAIRRVLEHAQRTQMAKASYHDAQGEVANALVRREAAFEQLENLDTIRGAVRTRIVRGAEIEETELDIRLLEAQARKAQLEEAAQARRQRSAPSSSAPAPQAAQQEAPDEYSRMLMLLRRMPEVAKVAADVKAEIVRSAGGDDRLTDADRDMLAMIDAIVQSATSRQAEDSIL